MYRRLIRNAANARWLGAAVALTTIICPATLRAQSFVAPGRIEGAAPTLAIGTAATGTIGAVLVREGSRVRAGQTLVTLECKPLEAELQSRQAHLAAAQANFDRVRNGPRPDEIHVGEAVVGYSQARADEAEKTLDRTVQLQEGVTVTQARVLEVKRDARIADAQLAEAKARLSLLRAGSREEDIRQAQSLRDAAAADLDTTRARLDQCTVHAPVDGVVLDVLANPGQYLSLAVPQPLLHMVQDDPLRVRVEVALRDYGHVCMAQTATVTTDVFANASIHAKVAAVSPVVTASSATAGSDAAGKDAVAVVLNIQPGAPALPIGLPVTVHFDACPSKT